MKKALSILLSLLMAFSAVQLGTVSAFAESALQASGQCGNNANYTFDFDTGALVISGTGAVWGINDGQDYFGGMASGEKDKIKAITINEGITEIGENAFAGAQYTESLKLPSGLKTIKSKAFYNCFALNSVSFPTSLETIDSQAFYNDNITQIDIPENVKTFWWNAFGRNVGNALEKAVFRCENVQFYGFLSGDEFESTMATAGPVGGGYDYEFSWSKKIPDNAFSFVTGNYVHTIEAVTLPDTITDIGQGAFNGLTKLTEITLPSGLKTIGKNAFYGTGLTQVDLPDGLQSIEDSAFNNADRLKNVTIPASVTSVGWCAFADCDSLTKATILNPDCEIYDQQSTFYISFVDTQPIIEGYDGSTAENYAGMYGYTFESLGAAPCPKGGVHDWTLVNHKATFTDYGYQEMVCSKCGAKNGVAIGAMPVKTVKLEKSSYVYTGKAITPAVTLESVDGPLAKEYYTLSYSNNVNVGTATVKVTLKGDYFTGSKTLTFKITPASNTLTVKSKKPTVKYSKLKKKNQTIALKNWVTVSKAQGKVTYKKSSGNKKITVSKAGKITVKKGLKKGTYKVKIKVSAAGNATYKAATKIVKVTIRVK